MQWWEYALEALGIISTVISVIAAIKSVKYYKKNKHLTLLVNANNALLEMQKISITMVEVLRLSNTNILRGKSIANTVANKGTEISDSIQKIKNHVSLEEACYIQNILKRADFDCQTFINTFISGEIIERIDGKEFFKHDQNFELCQERFNDVFQYLKERVEEHETKLI